MANRPDVVTYRIVMKGLSLLAKVGGKQAAPMALELLSELQQAKSDVTPDVVVYNAAMQTLVHGASHGKTDILIHIRYFHSHASQEARWIPSDA